MIDIVIPIDPLVWMKAEDALFHLAENTDTDIRVIAILNGERRAAFEKIENYLKVLSKERSNIYHSCVFTGKVHGYEDCITNAMALSNADHVMSLPPQVKLRDEQWWSKMLLPLGRDGNSGACMSGAPDTPSRTLQPFLMDIDKEFTMGRMVMFRRAALRAIDGCTVLHRLKLLANGGFNIWQAPGVRYSYA